MNEIVTLSKMSRRKFFKRCARKILFSDWVSHVLAFFVFGTVLAGLVQFGMGAMMLFEQITANYYLSSVVVSVYVLFAVFLSIPMLYGLMYFEICAVEDGKCDLRNLFYCFATGEKLIRSYALFFRLLIKTFLCFIPAAAVFVCLLCVYDDASLGIGYFVKNVNLVGLLCETVFVVLILLGLVLSAKHFVGAYICVRFPETKIKDAFFIAKVCTYDSKAEVTKLILSFVPLLFVSLYTFGLLFVMYSLPYMLLSFILMSKYLYDKEMYTQNAQKVLYTENEIEN